MPRRDAVPDACGSRACHGHRRSAGKIPCRARTSPPTAGRAVGHDGSSAPVNVPSGFGLRGEIRPLSRCVCMSTKAGNTIAPFMSTANGAWSGDLPARDRDVGRDQIARPPDQAGGHGDIGQRHVLLWGKILARLKQSNQGSSPTRGTSPGRLGAISAAEDATARVAPQDERRPSRPPAQAPRTSAQMLSRGISRLLAPCGRQGPSRCRRCPPPVPHTTAPYKRTGRPRSSTRRGNRAGPRAAADTAAAASGWRRRWRTGRAGVIDAFQPQRGRGQDRKERHQPGALADSATLRST